MVDPVLVPFAVVVYYDGYDGEDDNGNPIYKWSDSGDSLHSSHRTLKSAEQEAAHLERREAGPHQYCAGLLDLSLGVAVSPDA